MADETTGAAAPDVVAAAVPDPEAAAKREAEAEVLRSQARRIAIGLTIAILIAFAVGLVIVLSEDPLVRIAGIGLIGFAGSGVGALSSLLVRYSTGVALGDGTRVPSGVEGEIYEHKMAFPLAMRPVLGLLIAPLIVGALLLFQSKHEDFKGSRESLMIASFVGGLYAKSLIEAAKNAFKVVFRA